MNFSGVVVLLLLMQPNKPVVPFVVQHGVIVLETVKVAGHERRMLLDTGSQLTIISSKLVDKELLAKSAKTQLFGLGDNRSITIVSVTLEIGSYKFAHATVGVMDTQDIAGGVDGILGNDLLGRFERVNINYRSKVIELE